MFGLSRLAGSVLASFPEFYALPDAPMARGSQYRRHPSAARPNRSKYRPHQGEQEKARRHLCAMTARPGKLPSYRATPRQPGAFEYVWIDGKRPEAVSRQVRRAEDRRRWKAMRAQS